MKYKADQKVVMDDTSIHDDDAVLDIGEFKQQIDRGEVVVVIRPYFPDNYL